MKIDTAMVVTILRSFDAPQHVIDYFERMTPSQPEEMSAAERVGKQLDALRANLVTIAEANGGFMRLAEIQRRSLAVAAFRHDPEGSNQALKSRLTELIEAGEVYKLSREQTEQALGSTGVCYRFKSS